MYIAIEDAKAGNPRLAEGCLSGESEIPQLPANRRPRALSLLGVDV